MKNRTEEVIATEQALRQPLPPSAPAPSVESHEIDCLTHAGVDECRCAEKRQWRVEQAADRAAHDRAAVVTWLEKRREDEEAELQECLRWLDTHATLAVELDDWNAKRNDADSARVKLAVLTAELAALHADPPKEPRP